MQIKLSKPQIKVYNSDSRYNLFMAGQGSGKTYIMGLIALKLIDNYPNARGMICANTHGQLNNATMLRIREVWKSLGIIEYNEVTKQGHYTVGKKPPTSWLKSEFKDYSNILTFCNGNVIYLASLEVYQNVDGVEVAWALLDETKDTREEAFTEVIDGRVRQTIDGYTNQIFIFTSPSKKDWINNFFNFEKHKDEIDSCLNPPNYCKVVDGNKFFVISSAYLNAKNLPSGFIDDRVKDLPKHLVPMLIHGYPFAQEGGEHYWGFTSQNIEETLYNPELPLWLSFDFNVEPYLTVIAFQPHGFELRQIDEHAFEHPYSNTIEATRLLKTIYQNHKSTITITGDPSGKARSTRTQANSNEFKVIFNLLNPKPCEVRVANKAPNVMLRANFINDIFRGMIPNAKVTLAPKAKYTLADMTYVKSAKDGTKDKKGATVNGVEKYGHFSDALDYLVCEFYKEEYKRYIVGR